MNILMIGWEFPPYISGGLGVACHAIVQELARKKVNITVILPQVLEQDIKDDFVTFIGCNFFKHLDLSQLKQMCHHLSIQASDLFLHPYASCQNMLETAHPQTWIKKLKSTPFSGRYDTNLLSEVFRYALIAGAVAANTPHDAIHCHDWLTILAGVEAKRYSNKPLIFHVHALEIDRSGENVNQRIFDIEKYGMEQADHIITVSRYTKNMILKYYPGIPAEKITVAHNGIDGSSSLPASNTTTRPKMILFLGRITHQKGPYFFIELAKKILSKRQDIQFVLAGSGDLTRDMIEQVAKSRIGKYVHFTGFLDQENVKKMYTLADVFVMPSISEPFGLTCLEALSHKVPVVISKQSGVAETLPNVFKVDFWDIDQWTEKTLALLDHDALRNDVLDKTRSELKHITWEKTAEKIIGVYKKFIG